MSDLTSYAAVVVGPGHDAAAVRSVQLVGLGPRHALLVVVLADGAVEKRSIELDEDVDDDVLAAAGALLHAAAQGQPLSPVSIPAPSGNAAVDRVAGVASATLAELAAGGEPEQVFVGGPSRLAGAFDAVETVRAVLATLEQQLVVVTLLRDVLDRASRWRSGRARVRAAGVVRGRRRAGLGRRRVRRCGRRCSVRPG